jgi:hypothetical protein
MRNLLTKAKPRGPLSSAHNCFMIPLRPVGRRVRGVATYAALAARYRARQSLFHAQAVKARPALVDWALHPDVR